MPLSESPFLVSSLLPAKINSLYEISGLEVMQPIHELLSRIRHDRKFGRGEFEIGYFDRREGAVHRVAFHQVTFPEGERRGMEVLDELGQVRRIPLHRVREVWRNGTRIWWRPASARPVGSSSGQGLTR